MIRSLFLFAYTTSPAPVMKLVVFFRSSKPPYNFWWSGDADGQCAIRSGGVCYISEEHAGLSGPPHHRDTLGEGTIVSFLCMCALSLLWPERSCAKTTWLGLSRRWYASFSCLGFSAVLMMVVMDAGWWLLFNHYTIRSLNSNMSFMCNIS